MKSLFELLEGDPANLHKNLLLHQINLEFDRELQETEKHIIRERQLNYKGLANNLDYFQNQKVELLAKREIEIGKINPPPPTGYKFDPANPKLTWIDKKNDVHEVFQRLLKSNPKCCVIATEEEVRSFVNCSFVGLEPSFPMVEKLNWPDENERVPLYYAFGQMIGKGVFKENKTQVAIFAIYRFGLGVDVDTARPEMKRMKYPKPGLCIDLKLN
ncbi:MAG: hypothetical protein KKG00_05135 [Bacteroidetes bacterium]|nr:hypothetical protein [Bacteroidota bacterium]